MKFKKSFIEKIVREEFALAMRRLLEDDEKKGEPDIKSADKDNDNVEPEKQKKDMAPKVGADKDAPDKGAEIGDEEIPDEEVPVGDDSADDELSKDVEEPDEEKPEGGDISDDVAGKSIQSITMEPESKLMKGAKEIVLQFEEIPHPLRIIIATSGMVKFFYKGAIHNSL